MAKTLLLVYLFFVLQLTYCEDELEGWTFFKKSQSFFQLFTEKVTFNEAETNCQKIDKNAHLASFSSMEEYDLLSQIVGDKEDDVSAWIGMKHNNTPKENAASDGENRFELWNVDGTPAFDFSIQDYEHYWTHREQPSGNKGTEYGCIRLWRKLIDTFCEVRRPNYVCKIQIQAASKLQDDTRTVDPASIAKRKCLDGWTFHSSTEKCYKKFEEKLSFDEAEASCQQAANNSHLASFSSMEEYDFLANMDYQNEYWIGMKHNGIPREEILPMEMNRFELWFIDGTSEFVFAEEDYDHYWEPNKLKYSAYGIEPNGNHGRPQCIQFVYNSTLMKDSNCGNELVGYVCKAKPQHVHDSMITLEPTSELTTSSASNTEPSTVSISRSVASSSRTENISNSKFETSTTSVTESTTSSGVERMECLSGWSHHLASNTCYKKFSTALLFYEAEQQCQGYGEHTHLASFNNQDEFDFINSLDSNSSLPHWVGLRHNATAIAEFGAANRFTLVFLDKTDLPEFIPYNHYWASYTNSTTRQLIQEPNGLEIEHYKEACVMLCDQTVEWNTFCQGKLNDAGCNTQLPFACRMKLADYDYY